MPSTARYQTPAAVCSDRLDQIRRELRKLENRASDLYVNIDWDSAGSLGHMLERLRELNGEEG